jgi:ribonuclease-3
MNFNDKYEKMLDKFQTAMEYKFKSLDLLKTSFTHSSIANESRDKGLSSNERLEFLGDAVLNIIVSDYIFKNYQELPEGELTRIRASVVCEASLAKCAKALDFGNYLLLGKGEDLTGGRERPSILSDAFEAFLAAIYLDCGFDKAREWTLIQLGETIEAAVRGSVFKDYKTQLQEYVQKNGGNSVEYVIIDELGPDHSKQFFVDVVLDNVVIGKGTGKSKKEAEQNSANHALKAIKN